jgi:serine/threonine protein kinase
MKSECFRSSENVIQRTKGWFLPKNYWDPGETDDNIHSNCVHLLSWFEYQNHICLVSELLGISVYDFMKGNDFAPFPRHQIQKMARQLCSTVTCEYNNFSPTASEPPSNSHSRTRPTVDPYRPEAREHSVGS